MRARSGGFTWIELVLVLAVLGALALMAIPSMQDNVVKRQVRDGMQLADLARQGVQAAYLVAGEMPADNAAAGIPPKDKIIGPLVTEVSVANGAVTLVFGNNAHKLIEGKKLTIRPAIVPGQKMVPIGWLCHFAPVPPGMEVKGEDATDIPQNHLPADCRGPAAK